MPAGERKRARQIRTRVRCARAGDEEVARLTLVVPGSGPQAKRHEPNPADACKMQGFFCYQVGVQCRMQAPLVSMQRSDQHRVPIQDTSLHWTQLVMAAGLAELALWRCLPADTFEIDSDE